MTEISVTESLDGLTLPWFTHDRITRNNRGQVIRREFFVSFNSDENPDEATRQRVALLIQNFDEAGFMTTRRVRADLPDPRMEARRRMIERRAMDRMR